MRTGEHAEDEARRNNPALDEALKKAENYAAKYIDPQIGFFKVLEAEITEMPIAKRFKKDKKPDHSTDPSPGIVHPSFANLSEAEYKRAQLMSDLIRVSSLALSLGHLVKGLVMDIEATKQE